MKFFHINIKLIPFVFFVVVFILFSNSCKNNSGRGNESKKQPGHENDLKRIVKTGELRAVVDYNSTNYFVYRGKPMGFKYELLQDLCKDLGVTLEIFVSNDLNETFEGLEKNRYDVVAKNLTVTKQRRKLVDFTVPLEQTIQVLVQREKQAGNDSIYIESILQLGNKKVHVQERTTFYRRLQNLSEEIGTNIEIVEDTEYGVEQLVERVSLGEIDYTVCDQNVAKLNKTYYPNLDITLQISFPQNLAWAIRKGSDEWKTYLDNWIESYMKTRRYRNLYHRYFESPRISVRMDSEFHSINGGKISKFDKQVKQISAEYNWDWRLLSAIMYHESRFNPDANSWAGAYGLMQIMPSTARSLGVENFKQPKNNIKAGILLLNWLDNQFLESIPDSTERIKFVLASYNVGLGHVQDAQRLAEKHGKNKFVWNENVDECLRKKSSEKYFKDPVVRWGYCRGNDAVNYVDKVLYNFEHYLNVIPGKISQSQ